MLIAVVLPVMVGYSCTSYDETGEIHEGRCCRCCCVGGGRMEWCKVTDIIASIISLCSFSLDWNCKRSWCAFSRRSWLVSWCSVRCSSCFGKPLLASNLSEFLVHDASYECLQTGSIPSQGWREERVAMEEEWIRKSEWRIFYFDFWFCTKISAPCVSHVSYQQVILYFSFDHFL